jgi:hypothetical protein
MKGSWDTVPDFEIRGVVLRDTGFSILEAGPFPVPLDPAKACLESWMPFAA